jgi:hypothetical protein
MNTLDRAIGKQVIPKKTVPFQQHPSKPPKARHANPESMSSLRRASHLKEAALQGRLIAPKDRESFGHNFPRQCYPNCSIITFQNIGPQPQNAFQRKARVTADSFVSSGAGVALYAEHCLDESLLEPAHTFNYRMRRAAHSSFSYLAKNDEGSSGYGKNAGTGLTISRLFKSYKAGHACDPTGLGRWTFARFSGKGNSAVAIFSAYRPKGSTDPSSSTNDSLEKFDNDLISALSVHNEAGEAIVLGIDQNEDVRTSALSRRLKALGLIDAILTLHPLASPPATHNRSNSSAPTDAIWVSKSILVTLGGYCPFGGSHGASSNHRLLWIEVDKASIFGRRLSRTPPKEEGRCRTSSLAPRSGLKVRSNRKAPQEILRDQYLYKRSLQNLVIEKHNAMHFNAYFTGVNCYNPAMGMLPIPSQHVAVKKHARKKRSKALPLFDHQPSLASLRKGLFDYRQDNISSCRHLMG